MSSKSNHKKKVKSPKKIKPVKQKLKLFRSENKLLSVFMWGLNYSVSLMLYSIVSYILLAFTDIIQLDFMTACIIGNCVEIKLV